LGNQARCQTLLNLFCHPKCQVCTILLALPSTLPSTLLSKTRLAIPTVPFLGDLLYAYIVCCPDIGYAITTISKLSMSPAIFISLPSNVLLFIFEPPLTGDSIIDHPPPCPELPDIPHTSPILGLNIPVPQATLFLELVGYINSSHANNQCQHHSTT